jgi:hypothetical protein
VSESGGVWSLVTPITGTPDGTGILNGVSCVSSGECTAVGRAGNSQPMYVTELPSSATPPTSTVPTSTLPTSTSPASTAPTSTGSPSTQSASTAPRSLLATSIGAILSGGGRRSSSRLVVASGTRLQDQATLFGGNVASAGGTVTYSVYSNPGCSIAVAPAVTELVSAGVAPASPLTALREGTFRWVATYSGDDANEPSRTACGSPTVVVLSPRTFGADVAVSLEIEQSRAIVPGREFEITVTVTNYGPRRATNIVAGLRLPDDLSVSARDRATQRGDLLIWHPGSFAAGHATTYRLWVTPSASGTTVAKIDAGALSSGERDTAPQNNFVADQLTITRAAGTHRLGARRVPFSDRQLRSALSAATARVASRH